MAEVLAWQGVAGSQDALRRAVEALAAGKLVGFPTETVYGVAASGHSPEALARLGASKERGEEKPWTVALRSAAEARAWVPGLGVVGRRLAGRCWPGPLTLVSGEGAEAGRVCTLPEAVRPRVSPVGKIGMRVPAHEAILEVMRLFPDPLVLTSANRSGQPPATSAEAVREALGDDVALVLDGGPSDLGVASTVVEVEGDGWRVLREGVYTAEDLRTLAATWVVFVCTGNTCRSPLAEVLFKKALAEALGCSVGDLPARGWVVFSAGLAAATDQEATPEARAVARERGADLEGHRSQPLSEALAAQADHLIAMTQSHLRLLTAYFPVGDACPRLLCSDGSDLPDPIGGDEAVYRACAAQIVRSVEALIPEIRKP